MIQSITRECQELFPLFQLLNAEVLVRVRAFLISNRFQKGELICDPFEHCPGTQVTGTQKLQCSTVSSAPGLSELVRDSSFLCSASDRANRYEFLKREQLRP